MPVAKKTVSKKNTSKHTQKRKVEKIMDYDSDESDEYEESENEDNDSGIESDDDPPVIVRIPIADKVGKGIQRNDKNSKTKQSTRTSVADSTNNKKSTLKKNMSETIFENDIPLTDSCNQCERSKKEKDYMQKKIDDLEKQFKISKGNSVIINKPPIFLKGNEKKFKFEPVKIVCRNCLHPFDDVPMPLIEDSIDFSVGFNVKVTSEKDGKNGKASSKQTTVTRKEGERRYTYLRLFCTIGCALNFNDTVLNDALTPRRKSLTIHVFKMMLGNVNIDIKINPAPPLERLKVLGGDLTIKQYRKKSVVLNQQSIHFIPPMKPINSYIEERVEEQKLFDDQYVLKRSKPLNKKTGLIKR